MGFLKKLPAFPVTAGSGSLARRISQTASKISLAVGDAVRDRRSWRCRSGYASTGRHGRGKTKRTLTMTQRPGASCLKRLSR